MYEYDKIESILLMAYIIKLLLLQNLNGISDTEPFSFTFRHVLHYTTIVHTQSVWKLHIHNTVFSIVNAVSSSLTVCVWVFKHVCVCWLVVLSSFPFWEFRSGGWTYLCATHVFIYSSIARQNHINIYQIL